MSDCATPSELDRGSVDYMYMTKTFYLYKRRQKTEAWFQKNAKWVYRVSNEKLRSPVTTRLACNTRSRVSSQWHPKKFEAVKREDQRHWRHRTDLFLFGILFKTSSRRLIEWSINWFLCRPASDWWSRFTQLTDWLIDIDSKPAQQKRNNQITLFENGVLDQKYR